MIDSTFEATEWTVPDAASCYSIYFDEPTAWFVRAAAGPATGGVYLELPACSRDAGLRVLDRRLDSLLVDVREAGWRSVCFGQTDPGGAPVEVDLLARAFSGGQKLDDPTEDDPDPDPLTSGCTRGFFAGKLDDPTEDDPDPDPLTSGCTRGFFAEKLDDPTEDDPDPDPLTSGCRLAEKLHDPTEDDPDPDPLFSDRCTSRGATWNRICRAAGGWGTAHIPNCSPALEAGVWTEPGEGRLYQFALESWGELSFEAAGEAIFVIHDWNGQRLGSNQSGGMVDTMRLAPGRYWIAASGDRFRYDVSGF